MHYNCKLAKSYVLLVSETMLGFCFSGLFTLPFRLFLVTRYFMFIAKRSLARKSCAVTEYIINVHNIPQVPQSLNVVSNLVPLYDLLGWNCSLVAL